MPFGIALVVLLIVLVFSAIKVLNEYERGVMFTFGRFTGVKGPGIILVVPLAQQMRKVDLRVIVLNVPKQDVITRDNVSVKVNAVVYFRIVDAGKAIIQVENAFDATSQVAQTTGQRQSPGKTFKNKKMAGHLGAARVTTQSLEVISADAGRGVLMIKGSVPGSPGGYVLVKDAAKRKAPDGLPFPAALRDTPPPPESPAGAALP